MTEEHKLAETVARVIDLRHDAVSISPNWVATEAMLLLDPQHAAPALVYAGCHLQLRQVARQQLRGKYQPEDSAGEQHQLFPDLQTRYPTAHSAQAAEPEYVLLEHLPERDLDYNIARLEAEAIAKQKHADALRSYRLSQRRRA